MENKQALQVIKEVLDAAVKGGIFPNMDASFTAAQAYNFIANTLVDKEKELNDFE